MLMRTDPFRQLDQLFAGIPGTWSKPAVIPMDAYRLGDEFVVEFDLPGISPDAVELDVERNVLTVRAERRPHAEQPAEMEVRERPLGVFTRQLFLGDTLDPERIHAAYANGVLTLRIPVREQAKPRKIAIAHSEPDRKQINA
ncbi:Hsp20/alpha crystallin family protein [Cryptosporangium japonicum]